MISIRKTDVFAKWINSLKDIQAKARILARIERLAFGHPGDVKFLGEGISEMRIHHGPSYRVYFKKKGNQLVVLLAGGNKSSQSRDIRIPMELGRNLPEDLS
ncbi:MAG: hypothetical protein RL595_3209 [Planctomycetota bacterium]